MNKLLGAFGGAVLTIAAQSTVQAQVAPAKEAEPLKVAEARAIIAIMYPPATRRQMLDKMMDNISAPMRQNMPFAGVTDPGLKAVFKDYLDSVLDQERPLMMKHLPAMIDAMAIAYAHQFTLAELHDIHTFASTPSGTNYFTHATTILGDPAVQKVNADIAADAQNLAKSSLVPFKDKVMAYLKAHPEAAEQLAGQAQTQGK